MSDTQRMWLARFVIPLFIVWSAMLPYREAKAFLAPPGVIPPPAFVASAGGSPVGVGIAALTVGAVVGYLLVGAIFGDDTTDAVRIQLGSAAVAIPAAPSGTTKPATAGGVQCSLSAFKVYLATGATASACGESLCAFASVDYPGAYYNVSNPSACQNVSTSNQVNFSSSTFYCPKGYSLNAGVCTPSSSPRIALIDHKQDVLSTGTSSARGLAVQADIDAPNSVDGSKIAPIIRGDNTTAKTAYVYGKDSSGRTVLIEVVVSPDGSQTYVRHYTQDDSTGQSQIQKTSVVVDAATGVVTSIQKDVSAGSISAPSSASLTQTMVNTPTASNSPQVVTSTATPVGNSAQSQTQTAIQFPTDYARTGEAATAANTITPKLDILHHDLTDVATAPVDPILPEESTYKDFGNTFDALKGWQLPGHTSQCPTSSFSVFNQSYTIDAHCALVQNNFGIFNTAMSVVWSIAALMLVLKA